MWLKLVGNPLGMGAAKLDGCDPIALPFAAHFGIKRLPLSNILAVQAVIGEPVSVSFSLFVGKMQRTFGA
jgi:hypothetical protein